MTALHDHFAVLRQPRRPWLDADRLKERYQQLTFELHPDRQKTDAEAADFSEVTEAYRVLGNPRLRLLHLRDLQGNPTVDTSPRNIPKDLADLFMEAATLVQQIDAHRQKQEHTASTIGKSLLQAEMAQLQNQADETLRRLESCYDAGLEDLRRLDEAWSKEDSSGVTDELRNLADRFGYLDRWIGQLREKLFQLST